jgi:D-alanyl-D-alanine carboxypeptidase
MRRILPYCFCLLLGLSTWCAAAQNADSGFASEVDTYVQSLVDGNNFSGSVLIARGGKIIFEKNYGMANYELQVANSSQIRFHIASISKSFTAAAILMLAERGKLNLDDALTKFIPDYPDGDKITIHHLLTHRSGIPNANDLPEYDEKSKFRLSLAEVIDLFKNKPLQFPPGSRFRYSNSNYNLLAYIVEKTSGQSYGEFLAQNIFRPLAMSDTADDPGSADLIPNRASGYVPAGMAGIQNAPYLNWSIKRGNGSLYSTVEDLYKWDRALYSGKILSPASRDKMFTDYGGFGYGWFVRKQFGRPVTSITGRSPGFTSSLQRFIDDDACIIVTANTYSGITQSMSDDLAAMVFGKEYQRPPKPAKVSPALLQSYLGHYQFGQDFTYNPGASVAIEKDGNDLLMRVHGDASYLIPQSQNSFVDRLYGGTVTFKAGGDGQVTELTWNFGKDFAAKKLPESKTQP